MNKTKAMFLAAVLAGGLGCVQADTLFTVPVIYVRPVTLDFGAVKPGTTATNSFVVENMGRGTLVGKATVQGAFKIISGQDYSLGPNEAQVVTIVYTPTGAAEDVEAVKFTGGSGTTARVKGKAGGEAPKKGRRK